MMLRISAATLLLVALGCGSAEEAIKKGTEACQKVTCPGGTEQVDVSASSDCSADVSGSTTGGKIGGKCIGSGTCQVKCLPLQACCGGLTVTPTTYDCKTPCVDDPCSCSDKDGNALCKALDPAKCGGNAKCTCASGSLCDTGTQRCVSQCGGGQVACGASCCGSGDVCTSQNQCCNLAHECGTGAYECGHPCGEQHGSCGTCPNGKVCDEALFKCVAAKECESGQTHCATTTDGKKLGLILECVDGLFQSKGQTCSDTAPLAPHCKDKAAKAVCVACLTDAHCAARGPGFRCQEDNTCAFAPTPCDPPCTAPSTCNQTTGQCETCQPSCGGKVCGGDGCGGSCGTCENAGTCAEAGGGGACACAAGWEGPTCATNTDDCTPNPCQNGGTCTDGVSSFTCTCPAGWEGPTCASDADDCTPNPCENGGTCTDGVSSFTCACAAGWEGPTCATNTDDCAPNPCQNGGTCTDGVDSFTCACAAGWEGPTCEANADDCTPNPCQNGGTCTDGLASFTCECAAGYEGPTCGAHCVDGWCRLSPGGFTMGSPEDEPCRSSDEASHAVTLTRSLWIGQTEVTQAQWAAALPQSPTFPLATQCADCPAQSLTWVDALGYANALSVAEGRPECYVLVECDSPEPGLGRKCMGARLRSLDCTGYRLPTEAEWEYAARAGTTTAYSSGPNSAVACSAQDPALNPVAWYGYNPDLPFNWAPQPVAQLLANPWGLHDMHGNVWEWIGDAYGDYQDTAAVDPVGAGVGGPIIRGGSYDSAPERCRSAAREWASPEDQRPDLGLRLVRTIPGPAGSPCDDGDPCTTGDAWAGEICHGTPLVCAGGACLDGSCVKAGSCGVGWCLAPAGTFSMGSPPEELCRSANETLHPVTLTRAFWVGWSEVTQAQWSALFHNPSYNQTCPTCPVETVTWYEALAYANARSELDGYERCYELQGCNAQGVGYGMNCTGVVFAGLDCTGYRLPTEAEWEYATRAGTSTAYWLGDTESCDYIPLMDEIGWHALHPGAPTLPQPVGLLLPNPWGLYDVHGNVQEWVFDGSAVEDYSPDPVTDPIIVAPSPQLVRGGSFRMLPQSCRSASRLETDGEDGDDTGFRLVRTVSP